MTLIDRLVRSGLIASTFLSGCALNNNRAGDYSESQRSPNISKGVPDSMGNMPTGREFGQDHRFNFVELNNDQFYDFIGEGRRVVLFYADWAGPCKKVMPEFEKVAREISDVYFGKVNIDNCKDLASKFSIGAIPRTLLFEEGREIKAYSGFMSADLIYRRMGEAFK